MEDIQSSLIESEQHCIRAELRESLHFSVMNELREEMREALEEEVEGVFLVNYLVFVLYNLLSYSIIYMKGDL